MVSVSKLVVGILFLASYSLLLVFASPAQIQPAILSELEIQGSADVIVSLKVGTNKVLETVKANSNSRSLDNSPKARQNRLATVVSTLEHHAEVSQKNILNFLTEFIAAKKASTDTEGQAEVESLWITNQIVVRSADSELITALAQFEEVKSFELNEIVAKLVEPYDPIPMNMEGLAGMDRLTWGVQNVGAVRVWNMSDGNAGEGVIVAVIDTGVRGTHEAIKDNFLGQHGWLDPYDSTEAPIDLNGHGTHVTGTILGNNGIGVAPKAKWIACMGCLGELGCYRAELIACGQFAMCPDGSINNCTKAAHIVCNSWAGGQGQDFYDQVIGAWQFAGLIPVFAAGNEGADGCGSASSPGDNPNVISVGATNETNAITWFSGRGPSVYGTLKPDISAPGWNITSSYNWTDTAYASTAGTSMACPHVAGVIALLKSAKPDLTYEEAKKALFDGAERDLLTSNDMCFGIIDTQYPNYFHGHGKVNAYNSILLLNSGVAVFRGFNTLGLLVTVTNVIIMRNY
jgi:subtilisin family serine protease